MSSSRIMASNKSQIWVQHVETEGKTIAARQFLDFDSDFHVNSNQSHQEIILARPSLTVNGGFFDNKIRDRR
jgi:hypothetical protein